MGHTHSWANSGHIHYIETILVIPNFGHIIILIKYWYFIGNV